jgi:hypothetical protein
LLYMFIPKNRASDYIKQNLTEIEKYEIIVWNVNMILLANVLNNTKMLICKRYG